ncbi:hypothetical protein ACFO3A_07455 [Comamonas nitrativorans]|uniref:Uncharacterized protein n=1 Tax=Comamonas nitrativorans TaxID=108437 RepID=A0ABV9GY55_9BURK
MKPTPQLPEELHLAELRREQAFKKVCLAAQAVPLKIWQLPFAYLAGVLVGVFAYFAQTNLFLAITAGAAVAALNVATAAAVSISKTNAALVALIDERERSLSGEYKKIGKGFCRE